MTSSVALYEALTSAPDDRTRARVIAEAFERLEERYPHLPDLATQAHLRETELRLQKEIEMLCREIAALRRETEQIRAELKADIEQIRAELKADIEQVRADLKVDIEQVRADLKVDIEQVRADLKVDIGQVCAELKADIGQVRAELKADIEQIRADLRETELRIQKEIEVVRREITQVKVDLLKWLVPLMFAQIAAIAALVKLL